MPRNKPIATKPYKLRGKGSSLNITIPRGALLFTNLREDRDVWLYANSKGELVLSMNEPVTEK
jgi:hypothetical protein